MRFNIKKLEIQNFRSIQKQITLEFKKGLYSVEGINLDEPSSFNGAGKSTLVSALYWCLTGNTLTNEALADDVVNSKINKDCRVTLYLETTDSDIKITRTRKDTEYGNDLLLFVNDQDLSCHKIAETQQRINQLITLPFDILSSTIIMTGDMKSAFSELSPQQRIQVLESIRDYSLWDKVREEANKDIKGYNKEVQDKNLVVSSLSGSLLTYQKMLDTQLQNKENKIKNFNLEEINKNINTLEQENLNIINEIADLNNKLALSKTKVLQDNSKVLEEMNNIMNLANKLKLEKQQLEFNITQINKEIGIIDSWFKNDTCPTCHRKLERSEKDISENTNKKEEYLKQINDLQQKISKIDSDIIEKRVEWSNKNKSISNLEDEKKKANAETEAYNKEINLKNNQLSINNNKIYTLNLEKNNHEKEILKFDTDIKEYTLKIEDITNQISQIKEEIKKIEYKCKLSTYYYKLLGSKGELRPYLLNQDIMYLNSCMQKYIAKFFKNTNVKLGLNGANIDIIITTNDNLQKNVASLSDGEKKRLNLSIQLALYDLIKSVARVEFDTLWLDEVETKLDPIGCRQLIEIIEDKSEELDNVFWITNNVTVKENIPNKIICKKKLGITEIYEE